MAWEVKKLGDVCEIINGGTPKTSNKDYWDGDILWITPKDLGKLTTRYVDDTPRKLTEFGLKKSSAKIIKTNSIILSTRAPIGHLAINKKEMATNQGCRGIIPHNELDTLYLYYFLSTSIELLNKLGTGTTFKELSTKALGSIEISVPPLPIQKRIVAILDEAFEKISKAKENSEQNLKNSKEVFESYLQSVFEKKGEGWEEKQLKEICEKITDGSHNPPKGIDYSEYIMLSSKNVFNDFINANSPRYLKKEDYESENKRTEVKAGDILLTIVGTIGRVAVVSSELDKFTLQRSVAVLKNKKEIVDSRFLMFLLQSIFEEITEKSRGVAQKGLYLNQIRNLIILLPSIQEQKQIVSKLDSLSEQTKQLESIYTEKLSSLEELKQSILQKAFKGELTEVSV